MADQKQTRRIFVIMPFSGAGPRDVPDLTAFFQTNLKGRIEAETTFRFRYVVERSADQFAINEHIRGTGVTPTQLIRLKNPRKWPNHPHSRGQK